MKNLLYLLTLLFLISCSKDFDELENISPGLEWKHEIGYMDYDYSLDRQGMASTTDNGFFLIKNDTLKKHNSDGDYELTTTIDADKIIATDDGFLIYNQGTSKIIALDNDLNINWEFSLIDVVDYLLATNDGYIITHSTSSKAGITKLSLTGEVEWQKIIDGTNNQLNAIQKTVDGFIAIGEKRSLNIGQNIWVLRLDNSGEIVWEKTHQKSETTTETGINIYQLDNGNFLALISENTTDLEYDGSSIMIFDDEGKLIDENQFENTYFKSIIQTNDGDFLAIGSGYFRHIKMPAPYSYYSNYHSAIATKINQEGKRIWQLENFVGQYDDMAHVVTQTTDHGFTVLADGSDEYGDYYIDVFKINPED